jgi:purine-nucleoside phosphorylase
MSSQELVRKLDEAAQAVRARSPLVPQVGLVLGSGLGAFAESVEDAVAIPYGDIPHMPTTSVSGHAGTLVLGKVGGVPIACLRGRVHLYEGYELEKVVFGARLLGKLGCFAVLLTNAAGGISTSFNPGTLMLISDHINLTGANPLYGPNAEALGPRFPDMTRAYDPRLAKLGRDAAAEINLRLEEGVYAGMHGPSYETPAEIRMLRLLGADAVGMSTVHEVIALRHMGVRVGAISCITNMAAGMTAATLDHAEVEKTAGKVRAEFVRILTAWIEAIGQATWEQTGRFSAAPKG